MYCILFKTKSYSIARILYFTCLFIVVLKYGLKIIYSLNSSYYKLIIHSKYSLISDFDVTSKRFVCCPNMCGRKYFGSRCNSNLKRHLAI